MKRLLNKILRLAPLVLALLSSLISLRYSDLIIEGIYNQTRTFTRMIEFDYIRWTLDALQAKQQQGALTSGDYLGMMEQHDLVIQQTKLLSEIRLLEAEINKVFSDPNVPDPNQVTASQRQKLEVLKVRRDQQAPLVESIIQKQVRQILKEFDLTYLGQEIPPVLYQISSMPLALIVSPRDTIRQDVNLSLEPNLTIEEKVAMESRVEKNLDVSALVVPVGGVGIYPTMVMSTTDINWLMEVVTHEWIHNYLTLRPLGLNYFKSGDLRTMNETTANLAGKELGRALIERFYPEFTPEPINLAPPEVTDKAQDEPSVFDFRAEMHTTRVIVDELLADGQIEAAEDYMEARRKYFWENGYQIRRLNQAYFAFYGAYADGGGGEAGQDPVGPAVVKLREASPSLAYFLRTISQMTSFEELQQTVNNLP